MQQLGCLPSLVGLRPFTRQGESNFLKSVGHSIDVRPVVVIGSQDGSSDVMLGNTDPWLVT